MALSLSSRTVDVIHHRALWSPDFPRRRPQAPPRPLSPLRRQILYTTYAPGWMAFCVEVAHVGTFPNVPRADSCEFRDAAAPAGLRPAGAPLPPGLAGTHRRRKRTGLNARFMAAASSASPRSSGVIRHGSRLSQAPIADFRAMCRMLRTVRTVGTLASPNCGPEGSRRATTPGRGGAN